MRARVIQALSIAALMTSAAVLFADTRMELDRILVQIEAGEYSAAEARARELFTEAEVEFGPDSPEAAEVLETLVRSIERRRPFADDDIELARRLVGTRRQLYGNAAPEVADSLYMLSTVLRERNDLPAAVTAAEEMVSIREDAFGEDHPETTGARVRLASLLYRQGRYAEARPLLENVMETLVSQPEPDELRIANTANGLASTLFQMGDYPAAREMWERALEIRMTKLGPEDPSVAQSLNNIALMHYNESDFVAALATYRRALAIREKSLGPDHADVGYSLNGIAHCLWVTGDFAAARSHFERALEIFEIALGPDDQETILCRMILADVLLETGDAARALEIVDELLATTDTVFGPDHHWTGDLHRARAKALMTLGRTEAARQAIDRAAEILKKSLGPDHVDVAKLLQQSAGAEWTAGDHEKAVLMQRQAVVIFESALSAKHPTTAKANLKLAGQLHLEGDATEARALLERSLEDLEAVYGPDHPDVGDCLVWLSRVLRASGEAEAAFSAAQRAERIGREHFALVLEVLAESEALRYAGLRISGLDLMLSMLADGSVSGRDAALSAWDAVVRSRALVLDEMATRHRVARTDNDEVSQLRERVATARENLVRLVIRGAGDDPVNLHREQLNVARRRVESAERSLAAASSAFRDQQRLAEVGIEEVIKAVPSDAGIAAFILFSREVHGDGSETEDSYGVFVLPSKNAKPHFIKLGKRDALDRMISLWRAQLRRPAAGEAACRSAGEPVQLAVWEPLAALVSKTPTLFLIPDGAFNLVNLVALPTADGGYLVETGPRLHTLTSERDLASTVNARPVGGGLLALGGANFDATPAGGAKSQESHRPFRGALSECASFQSVHFEPLPASANEVKEVADAWVATQAEPSIGDAVSLTGVEASEPAFKQQAPGKRVLHLATHAFFLDGSCPSATRDRRGVGGLVPAKTEPNPQSYGNNPLHLAGFALAGANRRALATPDQDDGVLTAEEIGALDLRGVEWAVLSGCDTGLGVVAAGEGVLGLRRAFRVAGVSTVIMSLWPVDDEAARLWMETLYHERLTGGRTTVEAVHVTTLKVLQDRRDRGEDTHPASWAAFIAAGEWK